MIGLLFPDLLAEIDLAFQPLRGERGHVQTVVVKNGVKKFQTVIIKEFGDFVTDETPLLQPPHVRLEDQGLIPASHVKTRNIESNPGTHAG